MPSWITPVVTVNALGHGRAAQVHLPRLHGTVALVDFLPVLQGVAEHPTVRIVHA